MLSEIDDDNRPLRSKHELLEVFQAAEKPAAAFRIGMESEKFGVHVESGRPLSYSGEFAVVRVFEWLTARGFRPQTEAPGGPVIALRRDQRSITLEPGSQLELSGAPLDDLHAVRAELDAHLSELAPLEHELGLVWLGLGFHPLARQSDLDWVPKQRYAVMREYLPKLGHAAHDMMRRAATVQVNLDFSSEADALRKLVVCLKLSPIVHALAANAPLIERRVSGKQSLRGEVWLNMDPSRSGLIERVLRAPAPSYVDYVEWALDSGMFLIKRGGDKLLNTGQSFRDFLENGFQGERARVGDWKIHLNTLFPEARLKNTLEARCSDAQSQRLSVALPALWVGLMYDETALARAEDLARELDVDELLASRNDLVTRGLQASIGRRSMRPLAERVLQIAADGLDRRKRLDAAGNSERVELEPLVSLVSSGMTPADRLLDRLSGPGPFSAQELVRHTRIDARDP